jgi:hypothetical protein
MLNIAAPATVTIRDMQWTAESTIAIHMSAADQAGGRIQIVGSMLGPLTASHLLQTQLSLQANPAIKSISFNDVMHAAAISNGVVGPVSLTASANFFVDRFRCDPAARTNVSQAICREG